MEQQLDNLKAELAAINGQPVTSVPNEEPDDTGISNDDPAVLHLMRTVTGEEWLDYWPHLANRSLPEAKHIVRLQRIAADKSKSDRERDEAVQGIARIRKRVCGDRD